MKSGMMMLMAVLLNVGAVHAEPVKPAPGFDRVGLTPVLAQTTHDNTQLKAAPGEGADQGTALQARKREMARRLVWLMLSAR